VECIVMLLWKIRDSPGKGRGESGARGRLAADGRHFQRVSRLSLSRLDERLEN